MNSFFSFDFLLQATDSAPRRCAVILSGRDKLDLTCLTERLTRDLDLKPSPEVVIVIGPDVVAEELTSATTHQELLDRIPHVTRFKDPPGLIVLAFDHQGKTRRLAGKEPSFSVTSMLVQFKQAALLHIFHSRNGMLHSTPSHHYEKPSGAHSDRFIRAAELIVSGAEVNFFAFCLLPFLRENTSHIYCDTGSICAVAYALSGLRRSMRPDLPSPTIDSFSSYHGLERTEFFGIETCLFIISASTSGHLVSELRRIHHIAPEQVVTLFYLSDKATEGEVLCNLTHDPTKNPQGFAPIVNYNELNCPMCRQGSLPLRVAGDHFLPKGAPVHRVVIGLEHMPSWLSGFVREFAGKEVLKAHSTKGARRLTRELFVDFNGVFGDNFEKFPTLKAHLHKVLTQSLPAALSRIITLDDPGSIALAERVKDEYTNIASREVKLIYASDLLKDPRSYIQTSGATMVAVSCVVTGRSLLSLCQTLRTVQQNDALSFLIGVARTRSKEVLAEIRANITHGKYGRDDYDLKILESIFLPETEPARRSPWDEEYEFWKHLLENSDTQVPSLQHWVESRMETIAKAAASGGLSKNLFLPPRADDPLKLRRNFAFFKFDLIPAAYRRETYILLSRRYSMRYGNGLQLRQDFIARSTSGRYSRRAALIASMMV